MILLYRQPLEPTLAARVADRAQRLRNHLEAEEDPPSSLLNQYRDPELKQHLLVEAHGKCVYCESKITHVYFGDVEHMRPKSRFPAAMLDVENLAIACAKCNNAKGEFWDDEVALLNPYTDDPNTELLALGYLVARRPGKDRARLTIERLDLNRQALLERRRERIELLQPLADQYAHAPGGAIKELLKAELCRNAANSGEYVLIVRAYLEAACGLRCADAA